VIIDQTRDMFGDLRFTIEIGPMVDGDTVAGRSSGQLAT
jgi:hypothetical protein